MGYLLVAICYKTMVNNYISCVLLFISLIKMLYSMVSNKDSLTEKPDSPLTKKPDSPLTEKPDSPLTKKPDAPLTKKPDSPLTKKPDSPLTKKPDSPLTEKELIHAIRRNFDGLDKFDAVKIFLSHIDSKDLGTQTESSKDSKVHFCAATLYNNLNDKLTKLVAKLLTKTDQSHFVIMKIQLAIYVATYGTARFKLEKNLRVNYTWHYTSLKIFVAYLRALGKVITSPPLVESKHTCYKLVTSLST